MLAIRLNGLVKREGLQIRPGTASVSTVQEYVAQAMEQAAIPMKQATKVNIALDEMYSNIVHYSGAGWAEVICRADKSGVTLILRDNGVLFDPLQNADPDINQSAEERRIGGLGVFMTRKMMDEMCYRYADGCNELTMTLKISGV